MGEESRGKRAENREQVKRKERKLLLRNNS
jgi:hypothetical protein